MNVDEVLTDTLGRVREVVQKTLDGLDTSALAWRPDPKSNSIAWLVWHLTRVQDDHVADIAEHAQVWTSQAWAERFDLPAGYADTGFGHSARQVAAIAPSDPRVLLEYHDVVADQTARYLHGRTAGELDRVIDSSYHPPVTVGVRLVSVAADSLQHAGQAAYVRGLYERRTPAGAAPGSAVDLDDLPDELRSRVLAATAQARYRRTSLLPAQEGQPSTYRVEAVAGDRLTTMDLALRHDGSVAETTHSIDSADVSDVRRADDGIALTVGRGPDAPAVVVSRDAAAAAGLLPSGDASQAVE